MYLAEMVFGKGCSCEFGAVAVVPPFEMLRRRVECHVALQFCAAEVKLTLKVDFRDPILNVDCRVRPR